MIQKPNPCLLPLRRDKYERKLLWFWAETGYEGERLAKDEEELTRTTEIAEGFTDKVALGLDQASSRGGGPLPPGASEEDSSDESMCDDDDDDDDDDNDDDIASEDESDQVAGGHPQQTGAPKRARRKGRSQAESDTGLLMKRSQGRQAFSFKMQCVLLQTVLLS